VPGSTDNFDVFVSWDDVVDTLFCRILTEDIIKDDTSLKNLYKPQARALQSSIKFLAGSQSTDLYGSCSRIFEGHRNVTTDQA
jgi:hypothetical protein